MREDPTQKPNTPIEERELSKEDVEEYLKKASVRELGIWHDKNAIIVWLCRKILKLLKEPKP